MRSASATRRAFVLFALALGLGASACGIPIDSAAKALPAKQFGPLAAHPTSTTIAPAASGERGFEVYFMHRGVLSPVSRPDPSTSSPPTVAIAVEAINNGPDATEIANGYESVLSEAPGAQVSAGSVVGGIATVVLNLNFVTLLVGPALYEAYGEIVLSLITSAFPGIKGVRFFYDQSPIAALLPNGSVITTPVVPCDYDEITTSAIRAKCI